MTAVTATAAGSAVTSRTTLLQLAAAESKRYARHPLFLLGVGLLVADVVVAATKESVEASLMAAPITPAMLLGVFGLIVAARLTRTATESLDTLGAPPVPERTRTAALAIACLVPTAVAAVWAAFTLVFYSVHRPDPGAWWFDTLPAADVICYVIAASVVAAYGGSILGVLIGRWTRWPGLPLVSAVLLVAVTIPGSGLWVAFRPYREIMPWTHWLGGDDGHGRDLLYGGNPRFWLAYVIGLCVLGVIAAMLHDRELPRRRLFLVGVAVGAVALTMSVLAMTTGVQETRWSGIVHHEQVQ